MCFEWGRNYSRYVHKHFKDFLFIQIPLRPLTNFCKIRAAFPEEPCPYQPLPEYSKSSRHRNSMQYSEPLHPKVGLKVNENSRPACTRLCSSSCISGLTTNSDELVMLTDLIWATVVRSESTSAARRVHFPNLYTSTSRKRCMCSLSEVGPRYVKLRRFGRRIFS